MRSTEPWGGRRLELLLERAAAQEAEMWKVYVPKKTPSQDADISPAQRDEAVRWLIDVHRRSQLHPETLVLAVNILDRFLAPIKARPKYLRCIAITCFFLAAKTCEEDECVPSLKHLASSSSCGCSPSEILRMERIVLDKLSWNLHSVTALDFLHVFHAIATSSRSGFSVLGLSCSQHLMLLTEKLYHCLSEHTLSQLRGSMLALALVSLELETCCPDWLPLTFDLLRRAQTDSSELIRSRELVSRRLSSLVASPPPNTVYIYQPLQRQTGLRRLSQDAAAPRCFMGNITSSSSVLPEEESSSTSSKHRHHRPNLQTITLRCKASTKRKVEEMEVDDFYDGIKRLYNEDVSLGVQEGAAGGGSSSPCPPLQPVSAT